jgi:hypothetical protein
MRFEVLTVVAMKITVIWDVMPCSMVQSDLSSEGASLHLQERRELSEYTVSCARKQ